MWRSPLRRQLPLLAPLPPPDGICRLSSLWGGEFRASEVHGRFCGRRRCRSCRSRGTGVSANRGSRSKLERGLSRANPRSGAGISSPVRPGFSLGIPQYSEIRDLFDTGFAALTLGTMEEKKTLEIKLPVFVLEDAVLLP